MPLLQARHVGRWIEESGTRLVILQDISLTVAAGDSLAILGASGSGKSTLLALLAGLDVPSTGEIWLEGQRVDTLDEEARAALRARLAGFMFQAFHLLPSSTALQNVMLPLELQGVREARGLAEAALAEVGLAGRLHHLPSALSGGEQQRVALARALVTRPRILFADEPTGNLDRATGARILDLLFGLNAQHGTTLVLVTHDAGLAARCSRQVSL